MTPLGDVAQHRVRRASGYEPHAHDRRRALRLPPHDLAPQQQAEVVLEDAR